jgi:hypothetical protein
MKHIKKKLTAILLAVAMVLSLVPLTTTTVADAERRTRPFSQGGYGINETDEFTVFEAIQILRALVELPSAVRHATGEWRVVAFWEYELMNLSNGVPQPGIQVFDAIQILRDLVELPTTARRRVCERNNFTGVVGDGCGQRPTWVELRVPGTVLRNDDTNGHYYRLHCACVAPPDFSETSPTSPPISPDPSDTSQSPPIPDPTFSVPRIDIQRPATAGMATPGGTTTGDVTFSNFSGALTADRVTWNGQQIVVDTADLPAATYTFTATRGGVSVTVTVIVIGEDDTTPPPDTSPPSDTTQSPPPSPDSTTTPPTAPSPGERTGPCRNTARPAPTGGTLAACTGANSEICVQCGYCHPCDWFWYGARHCGSLTPTPTGCGIGSDCAAFFGTSWCAVCLLCADCCGPNCTTSLAPPGLPAGSCGYCLRTTHPICPTCNECSDCLYNRPYWNDGADPWGIVICATARQCSNCLSMQNIRP